MERGGGEETLKESFVFIPQSFDLLDSSLGLRSHF